MGRTIVCGDIHGNFKALKQCLERSSFDYKEDTLIQIGDIVDGIIETKECIDELRKIKNIILISGNHDEWFKEYVNFGLSRHEWLCQGGFNTLRSYGFKIDHGIIREVGEIPATHIKFINKQQNFFVDEKNNMFVHGGFNRHFSVFDKSISHWFSWDRDLWMSALANNTRSEAHQKDYPFKIKDEFKEVFIGHTSTENWKTQEPMNASGIWNVDTGAGFKGKLTFMDVDTKEYWQSDTVKELYGETFR